MTRLVRGLLVLAIAAGAAGRAPSALADACPGTFSIVAYDSVTQEIGVAVQSRYFSVGRVVPWAEAGVGAVATQSNVNASYGPKGLAMLRDGMAPAEILGAFAAIDSSWATRQLGIVDAHGRVASWTGTQCNDWAGGITGEGFAAQGNILAGPDVVSGMARAFRNTRGELAERLIAALEAAQAAGGDKRGQQSATLIVVRPSREHPEYAERYVDLHIEDHPTPIKELRRLWQIHQGFHGAGAHMDMAAEYESQGRGDLARLERERVGDILTSALKRGDKDATMLNGLAWTCATHDLHLDEALVAAQRAAAIEPKSTDVLDTLAEVYFRTGRTADAIATEKRAVALDPKNEYLKGQITRFEAGRK